MFLLIPSKYNYTYFIKKINDETEFFYLRNISLNYLKSIYDNDLYDFVSMLVFNEKPYNSNFYIDLKNLGILHLFTVSGFHINVLLYIFNKYIIKNEKINF